MDLQRRGLAWTDSRARVVLPKLWNVSRRLYNRTGAGAGASDRRARLFSGAGGRVVGAGAGTSERRVILRLGMRFWSYGLMRLLLIRTSSWTQRKAFMVVVMSGRCRYVRTACALILRRYRSTCFLLHVWRNTARAFASVIRGSSCCVRLRTRFPRGRYRRRRRVVLFISV